MLLLALSGLAALAAGAGMSAAKPRGRGAVAGAHAARPAKGTGGILTASCRDAIGREPNGIQRRVILGVVSVPPRYVPQVVRYQHDGWAYWSKWGLSIQAGNGPVRISVPKVWRKRVAIEWGLGGPVSEQRFEACSPPPTYWNAFAGGFSLSAPACVPLVIQVAGQRRTVRFGVGHRCP